MTEQKIAVAVTLNKAEGVADVSRGDQFLIKALTYQTPCQAKTESDCSQHLSSHCFDAANKRVMKEMPDEPGP